MPFAALADEFHSDPKTVKAGLDGTGLYARALSYCCRYLTDGFVPLAWAAEIARPAVRRKVTAAGLWVEVKGGEHYEYIDGSDTYTVDVVEPGFFIPDYLHYNPSRASIVEKREELSQKRAEAGRKGAMKRWSRTDLRRSKPDGKAMANGMATGSQTDSPLPLPLKNSPKAVTELGDDATRDPAERPGIDDELPVLPTLTLREIA